MSNDELLDVIDKNNIVVGQALKSKVHEQGLFHRVSVVLLKRADGRYLIPTASGLKVDAGGLFHSTAGHVDTGESYLDAAARELWEEVSITLSKDELVFLGAYWLEKDYPSRKENARFEIFEGPFSGEKIIFNEEQVDEQWFTKEELLEIYQKTPARLSYPLILTCKNIFMVRPENLAN
jgi:8-oxo-dGTP pyrophosphatase MutT (NUDIX family)